MKRTRVLIMLALPWLAACSDDAATSLQGQEVVSEREVDFAKIARGGKLFQQNCAECHGSSGEGAPNWRQRDADGMFPPPPLNGTGHAWHHPRQMLHYVIANGSPGGQGKMPAWGNRLSDEQIDDIILWFQSKWPDQVYTAWLRMDREKMGGG